MRRLGLAVALALGAAHVASAQVSTTSSAQINDNSGPNSSVVQPGLAKPPAGALTPVPPATQPVGVPPNMANNPTAPQLAKQPSASIGSPVPIAGAGGTTSTVAGTNHQEFVITRVMRKFLNAF